MSNTGNGGKKDGNLLMWSQRQYCTRAGLPGNCRPGSKAVDETATGRQFAPQMAGRVVNWSGRACGRWGRRSALRNVSTKSYTKRVGGRCYFLPVDISASLLYHVSVVKRSSLAALIRTSFRRSSSGRASQVDVYFQRNENEPRTRSEDREAERARPSAVGPSNDLQQSHSTSGVVSRLDQLREARTVKLG
ncbi:hypothetical protein BDV98DRAFT_585740 [Pterulicium gracile]|uniref:Uncharacterized protein n=1 Tax=Pterulicium gracile TaxID=1884261 RepID=A0A5C3Q843_9AGAR|nr:hypothetical protein BDV98DRAFT_585740 [Pterula gracilis]